MSEVNKVIVAVDFSNTSNNAFKTAVDLVEQLDAELTAIHCAPIAAVSLPEDGHPMVNEKVLKKEMDRARKDLSTFIDKHGKN